MPTFFKPATAVCVLTLLISGCSRTPPVEEISVTSSGVSSQAADLSLSESDWRAWRGPRSDGVAPDQPLATTWGDEKNILWSAEVPGRGHASPSISGDLIFLATAIDAEQKQLVLAFDRASGEQKWSTVVHEGNFPSRRQLHKKGSNANSTVACDGQHVFATFLNSEKVFVTALDLAGEIVWQKEAGPFDSKFGYAPSPSLYKSYVVIAADHRSGGYLAALDRESGEIAWRKSRPRVATYSSPRIAKVDGRDQLLISGGGKIASHDPATGDELWSCDFSPNATCGTIVVAGDRILASGGYPESETICVAADGSGTEVWSHRAKLYEPSMVVSGGHLFAITDKGAAYCWSIDSGEEKWRQRLNGEFSASPVVCNGRVHACSLDGTTFVFEASPDAYKEIARNKLGDNIYASPAVAGGKLFLRVGHGWQSDRKERLYCIQGPEKSGRE